MFKLFSERNKTQTNEVDVYTYDNIPITFRNQLFYTIKDVIERFDKYPLIQRVNVWELTHNLYCREKGLKNMGDQYDELDNIEEYIDIAEDTDLLDFIDFAFHYYIYIAKKILSVDPLCDANKDVQDGIDDLNYRFQQHKLGYAFVNGKLIRIDNEFIHSEEIKPALNLLHENGFKGAEDEFTNAFEALRNRDIKNAIMEAEKAFESTMKTICAKKKYPFDPERDTAKKLIETLKSNSFFSQYTENHLNNIAATLLSGSPAVRNRTSGHGQGENVEYVSDSYARYVIGLVAVNIVFLVQLYKDEH